MFLVMRACCSVLEYIRMQEIERTESKEVSWYDGNVVVREKCHGKYFVGVRDIHAAQSAALCSADTQTLHDITAEHIESLRLILNQIKKENEDSQDT